MDAADAPPRELLVDAKPAPGDSSDSGGSAMAPVAVPVLAAGMLAKFVSPLAGLAALGVGILVLFSRRKPREGRFVLRVEEQVLVLARERGVLPPQRVLLAELLDVTLDRETRQAAGRGATERMRIAFEQPSPAAPIFVPDARLTPLEAQEWHGKIRVFLRKHGWLPQDER